MGLLITFSIISVLISGVLFYGFKKHGMLQHRRINKISFFILLLFSIGLTLFILTHVGIALLAL